MSIAVNRRIAASPEAVWAALTDIDAIARADNGIATIEGAIVPGQRIRVSADIAPGRNFPIKVAKADPGRELLLENKMPLGLFKARLSVYMIRIEEGTDVEVSLATSGFMGRSISDKLDKLTPQIERFLSALEADAMEREPAV